MYPNISVLLCILLIYGLIKYGDTLSSEGTNPWQEINIFVCQSEVKCTECLNEVLNKDTISEKEVSSELFLRLQECKKIVPKEFQQHLESLKQEFQLEEKLPQACFQNLEELKITENYLVNFRKFVLEDYERSLNTFYLEDLVRFGLGTVTHYVNSNQGATNIPEGVCDTIIPSYVRAAIFAGSPMQKDSEKTRDDQKRDLETSNLESSESSSEETWYNPYGRFVHSLCGEDQYCRACNKKMTDIFKIRHADKNTESDIKVLKFCRSLLLPEFVKFSERLQNQSFKSCMKLQEAYVRLFTGHKTIGELDIKKAEAKHSFSNFKPFLDFLFDGVCYIYRKEDEKYPDFSVVIEFKRKKIPRAYKNILKL